MRYLTVFNEFISLIPRRAIKRHFLIFTVLAPAINLSRFDENKLDPALCYVYGSIRLRVHVEMGVQSDSNFDEITTFI